jgi:hypothetical protein
MVEAGEDRAARVGGQPAPPVVAAALAIMEGAGRRPGQKNTSLARNPSACLMRMIK